MKTPSFRILLVEDNPDDVALVRVMLEEYERAAVEVDAVDSAEACLARLASHPADIVLVDYGLPGENGLDLLAELTRMGGPPVVMFTGQGNERVATEAMRAGAFDYLSKDFITSGMLGHALHQAVEKARVEAELRDERLEGTEKVIFALAAAAEAKDPNTERHLQRMALFAVELGRALRLNERQLLLLRYGGLLHDIGKLGVSDTILTKRGPLTDEEWREMRLHPLIGERICAPLRLADDLAPIVRHHHEHWDGTGYVDGLRGERIPLLARIIGVVDAFDAMITDRPYRAALSFDDVINQLSLGAGSQFDPEIAEVFLRLISERKSQLFGRLPRAA